MNYYEIDYTVDILEKLYKFHGISLHFYNYNFEALRKYDLADDIKIIMSNHKNSVWFDDDHYDKALNTKKFFFLSMVDKAGDTLNIFLSNVDDAVIEFLNRKHSWVVN
jgi:hypothetical protein